MTALIYEFPHPHDIEGRPSVARRRSPFNSSEALQSRRLVSHKATDWAWEQPVRGVRQHVLLALAERANQKSWQCTPSLPELSARTGLGESTIRGHLRAMEEAGLLAAEWSNGGRRKRSRFTLLSPFTPDESIPETPQELQGKEARFTPQQVDPSEAETPQELPTNPAGAGPVVLRTNTGTREPTETTSAAVASAEDQGELFGVAQPAPVKAARSLAVIERKELAQANAGDATAAWVDGYGETHDAKPTARQIGQAARESRQLLEAGNPPERVVYAARMAGGRGLATVEKEYNALAKRRDVAQPAGHAAAPRPSTTDARVAAGIALAEKYARQEAAG